MLLLLLLLLRLNVLLLLMNRRFEAFDISFKCTHTLLPLLHGCLHLTRSKCARARAVLRTVHDQGVRVWGLGFGVWGLGFRIWGLEFRV